MKISLRTKLLVLVGVLIGVPVGTGSAVFIFADGASYLMKNPKACANCHVMQDNFDSWIASSHHAVATCNDCHTYGAVTSKYLQKGLNGFLHSWAFTTGFYHKPIRIKGFNRRIAMNNCIRCHENLINASQFDHAGFGDRDCMSCHQNAGHRR